MRIVITGGSKGIGRAIAEAFATENNHLLICARNTQQLQQTASTIRENFPLVQIDFMSADLSDKVQVQAFGDWCLQFGKIDILVNNAGTYIPGNVMDEPDHALENMLNCNLMSAYHLCRKIVPAMQKEQSGHIFNICSIAALQAYEGGGGYSISKFAMLGMSMNLRHELKSDQIKVTTVLPGAVMTDSWEGFDNTAKRIMEASDIAAMIVACSKLSVQAVVEEIIIRPQMGDL